MSYSVTVTAAQLLMRTLYEQLFAGHDLATAIRRGRLDLFNSKGRQAYFQPDHRSRRLAPPQLYTRIGSHATPARIHHS